jgi:integrase
VYDWVSYLIKELLYGNDDPVFPKTNVISGDSRKFHASGFKCEHWSGASTIRSVFRKAFNAAELPYFNPHSFRSTLSVLGQKECRTPEELKAWSQNLGHESVLTTFYSYGEVQTQRQGEIFKQLKSPLASTLANVDELAKAVVSEMISRNL